jgi:HEPN domain-containing protein
MVKVASLRWLEKAKDDLFWTQANIREKIWYGACFTAQQTAEKALKSYLLSKGKKTAKIHDLGVLLELCKRFDPSFEEMRSLCATLTDYYLPTRYPDISEFMTFSEEKANEAFELAKKIVKFVEKRT